MIYGHKIFLHVDRGRQSRPLEHVAMRLNSALALAAVTWPGAFSVGTNDQIGADIDYGTFQNPSSYVRPRFRYWANDASLNLSIVAEDVKAAGKAGAGGIELLGYYLYGDSSNFGGQLASPLQSDWTVYGFGSSAWSMTSPVSSIKLGQYSMYD